MPAPARGAFGVTAVDMTESAGVSARRGGVGAGLFAPVLSRRHGNRRRRFRGGGWGRAMVAAGARGPGENEQDDADSQANPRQGLGEHARTLTL